MTTKLGIDNHLDPVRAPPSSPVSISCSRPVLSPRRLRNLPATHSLSLRRRIPYSATNFNPGITEINMANDEDFCSSIVILDSTSNSSVICLNTSNDQAKHPNQCADELVDSVIVISDTSVLDEDDFRNLSIDERNDTKTDVCLPNPAATPATTASVQDAGILDCGAENKEPVPAMGSNVPSTPVHTSKRMKLDDNLPNDYAGDPLLASTPLAGTAIAPKKPNEPAVTPITVRYERVRADLSATKKEQKKLITVVEEQNLKLQELQEEMQKVKDETTKKRKREEEEEKKKSVPITLDVRPKQDDSLLRPVVIDGSNVAMSHGNGRVFSCKGISLCIQFFLRRGHKTISALVPQHCKNGHTPRSCPIKDAHLLENLESRGFLSFTPSRNLNGNRLAPYDDRMIVQLACRNGGVIVSNDNYRDLMRESADFKAVIESRLIMYTFVGDNFMVPEDPHGRYGPLLSEILRRPQKAPPPSLVHSALCNNYRRAPLEQLRYQWQNRF